ncbi:MAG: hypothetical protein JWN34_2037 [Bryobacterales bacterium]|nr:hypothetical protein [Bryobacterales bacterium]
MAKMRGAFETTPMRPVEHATVAPKGVGGPFLPRFSPVTVPKTSTKIREIEGCR